MTDAAKPILDESGAPDAPERRNSHRSVTVYKVVKVKRDGKEALARCRNVSETGMKLEVGVPLSLNEDLWVELTPDIVLHTQVVWTNGNECGVSFERHIDCAELLTQTAEMKRKERSRSPRVNSQIPAWIAAEGEVLPTTIKNISQRGMMVTHNGKFSPGLRVKVQMQNGKEREAVVRWTHDNFAGLMITDPFSVLELSDIETSG